MTPARATEHGRRGRGDRGAVGGIEALPFGLLLFVVGGLLVANAWAVIDAKFALTAAAREATRTYVEAPDAATAAADADAAARAAIAGFGRDPRRVHVSVPADPAAFTRCARVRIQVAYDVPAVPLPWIGGLGRGITVRAAHTELVDPYRDGVPGTADCG